MGEHHIVPWVLNLGGIDFEASRIVVMPVVVFRVEFWCWAAQAGPVKVTGEGRLPNLSRPLRDFRAREVVEAFWATTARSGFRRGGPSFLISSII